MLTIRSDENIQMTQKNGKPLKFFLQLFLNILKISEVSHTIYLFYSFSKQIIIYIGEILF